MVEYYTQVKTPMKRLLCVLLVGLSLSLTACAPGYYNAPYGYRPSVGYGYRTPVYGGYAYPKGYPSAGYQEHRDFDAGRGQGWGGNGWGERREGHEHHGGGEGRGWGEGHGHG